MQTDPPPFFQGLLRLGRARAAGQVLVQADGPPFLSLLVEDGVLLKVSGHLPLALFLGLDASLPPFTPYQNALYAQAKDLKLLEKVRGRFKEEDLWWAVALQASWGLRSPTPKKGKQRMSLIPNLPPETPLLRRVGAGFLLREETLAPFWSLAKARGTKSFQGDSPHDLNLPPRSHT